MKTLHNSPSAVQIASILVQSSESDMNKKLVSVYVQKMNQQLIKYTFWDQ